MKKSIRILAFVTMSFIMTSCELLIDYSGYYSGVVDVTMTIMGNTTNTQSPLDVTISKDDGVYYFDGVPLEGAGSTFSYTESDSGVDYIIDLEFTSTTLSISYAYELDLGGGMIYDYVISGTLDKQ